MTVSRNDINDMPEHTQLSDRILDQALELAEAHSWEAVRLHTVADALQIGLDDVHRCYAQKDDLVEAWFDRADRTMLAIANEYSGLPQQERIENVIMDWLLALSRYRRVTRQMLMYKLEPGHFHLQVLGLMRISRTVQWIREAARLETGGLRRIIEEISLTKIYLAVFSRWLFDDSTEYEHTRSLLGRLLRCHERCKKLGVVLPGWPAQTRRNGTQRAGL